MVPSSDFPADPSAPSLARRFPREFVWGVATSAFQIEGAASLDGKGESIWDRFCRQPGAIADQSNGDVACDHYHRWASDLDLVSDLGVDAYRFSVSWPRVQALGQGDWNEPGLAFYDRMVDDLCRRGLAPHLTLNHWDLPQALQERGGWASRETAYRFVDYALGVHRRVGDRCASITTHNEPWVIAVLGHDMGICAPGLKRRATAAQVAHHLLLSHGWALQALRAEGCRAELGIVLNMSHVDTATDSEQDAARARLDDGHSHRLYADPLFFGRYPEDVLEDLGSDAPVILEGDLAAIAQPLDFLGINNYTRHVASAGEPFKPEDHGLSVTDMGWEIRPQALTQLLKRVHQDYRPRKILITENGAAFQDELANARVVDDRRVDYLRGHISAVADARDQGVPVAGYMVWTLLDNFEWMHGYTKRFGIVHIHPQTLERTPKKSFHWMRRLMQLAHTQS